MIQYSISSSLPPAVRTGINTALFIKMCSGASMSARQTINKMQEAGRRSTTFVPRSSST